MWTEEIEGLVDRCTDPVSSEIPPPGRAVRLADHPVLAARSQIFDGARLSLWLSERSEDYNHTPLVVDPSGIDQKRQSSAARIQVIAMVASFNKINRISSTAGIVGAHRIAEILEILKSPDMANIGELGELIDAGRNGEYLDIQMLLTEILASNKIAGLSLSQAVDKINREECIYLLEQAMAQTFSLSIWSNMIEVFSWVGCLPESVIAQANRDLVQVVQIIKADPDLSGTVCRLDPIVAPAVGVFAESVDRDSIAWLKSHRVHESSLFACDEENEEGHSVREMESQKRRLERIERMERQEAERIQNERRLAEEQRLRQPEGYLYQRHADEQKGRLRQVLASHSVQGSGSGVKVIHQ